MHVCALIMHVCVRACIRACESYCTMLRHSGKRIINVRID